MTTISAASAQTLTAILERMETRAHGDADDVVTYDRAFKEAHRLALQQGGLNRAQELDQAFGPRARDLALAARRTGVRGADWADKLVANIEAAAAKAAKVA